MKTEPTRCLRLLKSSSVRMQNRSPFDMASLILLLPDLA